MFNTRTDINNRTDYLREPVRRVLYQATYRRVIAKTSPFLVETTLPDTPYLSHWKIDTNLLTVVQTPGSM